MYKAVKTVILKEVRFLILMSQSGVSVEIDDVGKEGDNFGRNLRRRSKIVKPQRYGFNE